MSESNKQSDKTDQKNGPKGVESSSSTDSFNDASKQSSRKVDSKQTLAETKKGGSVFFRILFNIVLLAGIGLAGYFLVEQDKAVNVLFEQQNGLSTQRNETVEQISQLQNSMQALSDEMSSLDDVQNQISAVRQETSAQIQQQVQQLARQQAAEIARLQNELVSTRLRISSTNSGASQQWLLAEAVSLLRLAQQQLIIARSVRTAQALYLAADDVLKQIDDPAVFAVRDILAGELATIRAVPEVDVQDIYLQLGTISNQLAGLQLTNDLAAQTADGERVTVFSASAEAEPGLFAGLFSSMKNLLNRFLVVRRRDEPIQALMTPGQEAALLQTVHLQIEQGRTALLKEEQEIYSRSLGQARNNIEQYLSGDAALKANILSNLDTLLGRRIVTEVPSLTRTRAALEQILLSSNELSAEAASQQ